jgi:hypothetical protein
MTVYGCRVPGCEWEGEDLDAHLIGAHGWTADELVTLAGLKLYWEAAGGSGGGEEDPCR